MIEPPPSTAARTPAIGYILVTLMLDVLGFGLIIPVAPKLVEQLAGDQRNAAMLVGYLTATYAAMQFFGAPLLGALSDRIGRRRVILIAQFGSGLDYFAMGLAPTLGLLFITRAINGLSGASMTACAAYIADVTPPEKRAAGFGMMGAAFGIGFILGPLMGGFLGELDIRYPFYAAGALTLVSWLYGVLVLPESLPREKRATGRFDWSRASPIGAMRALGRYPLVAGLAASFFLAWLAMFGLHATWVLYTSHRYQWQPSHVGLSLFGVGLGAAIVQGGLAGKVIARIGERRAMLLGLMIGVASYLGYGLATEGWMIYVIIALASLGGLGQPAAQSLITQTVGPTEQGSVQGALTALQNLANIAGPIIGSYAFAYAISPEAVAPFNQPGLSFLIGAGLCAGSLLVAWITVRRTMRN